MTVADFYDAFDKPRREPDQQHHLAPVPNNGELGPYLTRALVSEVEAVRDCPPGHTGLPGAGRNHRLFVAARNLAELAHAGLPVSDIEANLADAARHSGLEDGEIAPTIASGIRRGLETPRHPKSPPPAAPAVTVIETPSAEHVTLDEAPKRMRTGGSFILDAPDKVPTLWGDADDVIWARGEALMIVGPPGVGKTTLTGQLLRARLGFGPDTVLGFPVESTERRVLYLAMDRPAQIARALRRAFCTHEREALDERLRVWEGPPPADIAKRPEILIGLADLAEADTVIIDSLKDAAIGLGEDEVAGGYNRARQMCLANGIQVLELHHLVKRGANGGKPNTLADVYGSAWLTAGAGSVVLLWGAAGDPIVELAHLKQPAGEVGPFRVIHDHETGTSEMFHGTDLVQLAKSAMGVTARTAACCLFNTDKPSDGDVEKARRKLDNLVKRNVLTKHEGTRGGGSERVPATWKAITEAITALSAPEAITAPLSNHGEPENRRSGNHGSNHGNHEAEQSRITPPLKGGRDCSDPGGQPDQDQEDWWKR